MVDFNKILEEKRKWDLLSDKDKFRQNFHDCYEDLLDVGITYNDKIKKCLLYILKHWYDYKCQNISFILRHEDFYIGKYKDKKCNILKVLQVDREYYKWYILNIKEKDDDRIEHMQELYKIYNGVE